MFEWCARDICQLPIGLVKSEAVKGREGAKKRSAASEKESGVVHIEQVDMASPVFPKRNILDNTKIVNIIGHKMDHLE